MCLAGAAPWEMWADTMRVALCTIGNSPFGHATRKLKVPQKMIF